MGSSLALGFWDLIQSRSRGVLFRLVNILRFEFIYLNIIMTAVHYQMMQYDQDCDQLARQNRKQMFEITRLKQQNMELHLKVQAVDHMYSVLHQQSKCTKQQMANLQIENKALLDQIQTHDNSKSNKSVESKPVKVVQTSAQTNEQLSKPKKTSLVKFEYQKIIESINSLSDNLLHHQNESLNVKSWPKLLQKVEEDGDVQLFMQFTHSLIKQIQSSVANLNHSITDLSNRDKHRQETVKTLTEMLDSKKAVEEENEQIRAELDQIYDQKTELIAQINLLKQDNQDKVRRILFYENKASSVKDKNTVRSEPDESTMCQQNDQTFAIELLMNEKDKLNKLIDKIIESIQNKDLSTKLNALFSLQLDQLDEIREKMEVEFDLEELECLYKRENCHNRNDTLLIEMRKRIEQYRHQLIELNLKINQMELQIANIFEEIVIQGLHDEKMRNYCLDMEKKLNKTKFQLEEYRTAEEFRTAGEVQRITQYSDNKSVDDEMPKSKDKISFHQSSEVENIVSQAINQDRQNLERLFTDTRNRLQDMKIRR